MNRRLLILTNDGGKKDFLPGVEHDRDGFLSFFRSCYGGAWEEDEISCTLTNSMTREVLLQYFQLVEEQAHVDYWLIVFCGHGGADSHGRTFFELTPGDTPIYVEEIEKAVNNSRMLLIADSCRYMPMMESGGRVPRMILFSDSTSMTGYRDICRTMYNDIISSTPTNLHIIGYAAHLGQYARELDNGCGGQYSQALLECAKSQIDVEIKHRDNSEYVFDGETASFPWVHSCAKDIVIIRTKGEQTPQLSMPRTRQLPFWVVPKKIIQFRRKE